MGSTAEFERLRQVREEGVAWRRWGPYLSERQWGTVREDRSNGGDPWSSFTHEQARSRVYHWGEEGLAGFCDDQMRLCLALALWNGRDPFLKERMFGLANGEGNHGEDVKEYYYYLDGLPTHSYMRMLYKYPQREFPYAALIHGNRERSRLDPEYELIETGVFDDDRYFDVFVEYAKESPEEILMCITVANRSAETCELHLLPTLWFRNTWWRQPEAARPLLQRCTAVGSGNVIIAGHPELGIRYLQGEGDARLLFTDNETNSERLCDRPNAGPFVKDGINDYVVDGCVDAVDPLGVGTKAALHYVLQIPAGETRSRRLRLGPRPPVAGGAFAHFDAVLAQRRTETDEYYAALVPPSLDAERQSVVRQAFAGLFWSKQFYVYDVATWFADHRTDPGSRAAARMRNREWVHLIGGDVVSVPDKWEYPWFSAWDLAFQTLAYALPDPDFAIAQLELLLRERYAHPSGQMPATEWNFGAVNPPVHAWAALFIYKLERARSGERALENLRSAFHKLLLNFTWWVNRRDRNGRNVFEGGLVGIDTVGVGGDLEHADGAAWMALFSQNMLEMSLELALQDRSYEELAAKFYEHFIGIAAAMDRGPRHEELWDEQDGFYYDLLRLPDGTGMRLKVRSLVGLIPLCAVSVYPSTLMARLPYFAERVRWICQQHGELLGNISHPGKRGIHDRVMLSMLDEQRLRRVLTRVLDPAEFFSDYGIRSLSRHHRDHPSVVRIGNDEYQIAYRPAESDAGLFGGNANWRGPVWMPVNVLLVRALLQLYSFHGDAFRIECPSGSGHALTLFGVAAEIIRRLSRLFVRDGRGQRPIHGAVRKFQDDPYWRDLLVFHEYFHGDDGHGIGASHHTGWTALIGGLLCLFADLTPADARNDFGSVIQRTARRSTAN